MTTLFRSILGFIGFVLLAITSTNVANASGDTLEPFTDSTNDSAVNPEAIIIENNSTEKNLTESYSLSSKLPILRGYCGVSTRQVIDLDSDNYRWHNEDVNTAFVAPDFPEFALQSARLCISYSDVNFTSPTAYTPELNVVQFGDTSLDILPGNNGETLTKCWDVKSRLKKNTNINIPLIINIDAAHNINNWAVYLHQAVLSTCQNNLTITTWSPYNYYNYNYYGYNYYDYNYYGYNYYDYNYYGYNYYY